MVYLTEGGSQLTAVNILDALLSKRSPLSNVELDIEFLVYENRTSLMNGKEKFDDEDK